MLISPLNIDLFRTVIRVDYGALWTDRDSQGLQNIHKVMSESKPCPQLFDCTCGKWEAKALRATKCTSLRLFRLL